MKHVITIHKLPTILPFFKPFQTNRTFFNRVGSRVGSKPGEILLNFRWGYGVRRGSGAAPVKKVQRRSSEEEKEERESGEAEKEEERENEEEDYGFD
ncbi:hypothetical protein AgCh_037217 [Apium graveolens]